MYKINGFLLSVDFESATKDERTIELSHQEQEALKLFFSSEDGFVAFNTLEEQIWGERVVTSNSLRKLVSGLRLKFEDKNAFKNIRGKGYQVSYSKVDALPEHVDKNSKIKPLWLVGCLCIFITLLLVLVIYSNEESNSKSLPAVSTQTVFESKDYILDYALYDGVFYVTTRNKKSSKLYKVVNRQNQVLLEADYAGAYRGIEIHESGKTAMHVVENGKCIIKVFKQPVEQLIDEIPCNRQNAFASIDWLDSDRFFITFNVDPNDPIQPFLYDLKSKRLEKVTSTNFESLDGTHFIDAFIKSHDSGMFSLREDSADHMSLVYFEGDKRRKIYDYRAKPYSIGVSNNALFFVSNNNEILRLPLEEDIISQEVYPETILAPQATKIDDPLVLEGDLYFSLGNTSKEVIRSLSGKFSYSLENAIRDFTYTDNRLSILGVTNTGYVVEQLVNGKIINSVYFDTTINLRHVAFFEGDIFLAGASGIYKLENKSLLQVSNIKTVELVSTGKCMIAEGDGIHKYNSSNGLFERLAGQGERAFQSKQGCLYVDNLTGNILNEKREKVAKQTMNRLLIDYHGVLAHRHNVGEQTHIFDLQTGELLAKTKTRALFTRMIPYKGDILYLNQSEVNTSIVKLKVN